MPKVIKIPLIVIAVLISLLLILWLILQTSFAQNYIAGRLTNSLSQQLGTVVKVDRVKLKYFDHALLKGVYLEDEHADTMFYIPELEANYDLFKWSSERITFDQVFIKDAYVNLGIHEDDNIINLQFLINFFSPTDSSSTAKSPTIVFDEVYLSNTSFHYFNEKGKDSKDRVFNENDMLFSDINAELYDFKIINDSLSFKSKHLSTNEKCGLIVSQLSSDIIISSSTMQFKDLLLKTPHSEIKDYLIFNYTSYQDFADFISSVKIRSQLTDAIIHSKDIAYFSNALNYYDDIVRANGKIRGTIDRLRGKDLDLMLSDNTTFNGDVRVTGIPDMKNTYWDIRAEKFVTASAELARLIQLKETPDELLALGTMQFEGNFTGFLKEFVTYGSLETNLGKLNSDIKFKVNPDGKELYSGIVESPGFDLATLLKNNSLGNSAFALEIKGEGLEMENINTSVSGDVFSLDFNNYSYSNISIDGLFKKDLFEGYAKINDPNLQMDFDGSIDMTKDKATTKATTNIKKANLNTLGIDKNVSYVSLVGVVDIEGKSVDELVGSIKLDSVIWQDSKQLVPVQHLTLFLDIEENERFIDLKSEILDVRMKGDFKLSKMNKVFTQVAGQFTHSEKKDEEYGNLLIDMDLKSYHPLYEQYLSGLYFKNAKLKLDQSYTGEFDLLSEIDSLKYSTIATNKLNLSLKKSASDSTPDLSFEADGFEINDSLLFFGVNGTGELNPDALNFDINAERDSSLNAHFKGSMKNRNDSTMVYFDQVNAMINKKTWLMGKTDFANIVYHDGMTELFYFDFRNGSEILFFDGSFGENATKMNFIFDQFLLNNANPFLLSTGSELAGQVNGYIDITYREGFPIFESDLVIDALSINQDTLGDLVFTSYTHDSPLNFNLEGDVHGGLLDKMKIMGNVDFNDPDDALNVRLTTKEASIKPFEKYLEGLASNINGTITGDLKVTGALDNPLIDGTTDFADLRFTVDYLQTTYTGDASIVVGNNFFRINNAKLIDRFGHEGKASGQVTHKNYSNFNFDLSITDLVNFECMNTTRENNELFYGSAFADGYMEVNGPLEDILLLVRAKSRKGTKIYIPLDNVETDGQLSYVRFVDLNADNDKLKELVQTSEGVRMDFNFEITNDADVELIFDELLGDKIKGNGHGNLRMEVNTYGEFNMYGNIIIDKGDYLFTAFNFINKYFVVTPGSTLSWDGDPYNAKVDLKATKREYPLPSSLLAGMVDNPEDYDTPVPVDCELKLGGLLFNPDISFGLSFPSQSTLSSSNSTTFSTVIERVKQDPEELNRQVFALLALGTFIPPSFVNSNQIVNTGGSGTSALTNSVNNSLSDFVSSQLSNWLSQIDPNWQVGIDYQIASSDQAKAELILSLKRKFLNDRLELQGSYDASATTGSRPYDVNVQYNLSKDGSFKIKGFQRNANDPTLGNISNVTTSGVGFFYRHQFDHFWFEKKKKQN